MARGDIYECTLCDTQGPAKFVGDVPRCYECDSAELVLYMRAPSRAQKAVMRALSSKDIEAGLTDIDPDWRERFPDSDVAAKFYRLEG